MNTRTEQLIENVNIISKYITTNDYVRLEWLLFSKDAVVPKLNSLDVSDFFILALKNDHVECFKLLIRKYCKDITQFSSAIFKSKDPVLSIAKWYCEVIGDGILRHCHGGEGVVRSAAIDAIRHGSITYIDLFLGKSPCKLNLEFLLGEALNSANAECADYLINKHGALPYPTEKELYKYLKHKQITPLDFLVTLPLSSSDEVTNKLRIITASMVSS